MPPTPIPRTHSLSPFLRSHHPRLHPLQIRLLPTTTSSLQRNIRYASSNENEAFASKLRPLILEKPDKFRPPSHPARIKPRNPRAYGRDLTSEELAEQSKKQYPNMFPPEGTVMFYFLTNRVIHVWISMGVLFSIAVYMFFAEFHKSNKYPDMLPHRSVFITHPIQYLSQYLQVYKLHVQAVSQETAEKRAKQADDARKRREYLRAHGLDKPSLFGFGTVEQIEAEKKRKAVIDGNMDQVIDEMHKEKEGRGEEEGVYTDFEGKKKPLKKWLGIW